MENLRSEVHAIDGSIEQVLPEDGKTFSLEELEKIVEGMIAVHSMSVRYAIVVNDLGWQLELPYNASATEEWNSYQKRGNIYGNALVTDKKYL